MMKSNYSCDRVNVSRFSPRFRCHPVAARSKTRSAVTIVMKANVDWHEQPMKHVVDSNQFSKRAMDAVCHILKLVPANIVLVDSG